MVRFEDDTPGGTAAVVGGGDAFLAASASSCALRSGGCGTGAVAALYLCIDLQMLCCGLSFLGRSSIRDLSSNIE